MMKVTSVKFSSGKTNSQEAGVCECMRIKEGSRASINKYLQIFFVLVNIVEFEHVGMFDQLQNGYFPLHLEWKT